MRIYFFLIAKEQKIIFTLKQQTKKLNKNKASSTSCMKSEK